VRLSVCLLLVPVVVELRCSVVVKDYGGSTTPTGHQTESVALGCDEVVIGVILP
jgi:hypothetical protein